MLLCVADDLRGRAERPRCLPTRVPTRAAHPGSGPVPMLCLYLFQGPTSRQKNNSKWPSKPCKARYSRICRGTRCSVTIILKKYSADVADFSSGKSKKTSCITIFKKEKKPSYGADGEEQSQNFDGKIVLLWSRGP